MSQIGSFVFVRSQSVSHCVLGDSDVIESPWNDGNFSLLLFTASVRNEAVYF